MASVLSIIAEETKGKSYKTTKYAYEGIEVPRFDYDDHRFDFKWKHYGEDAYVNDKKGTTIPLKSFADRILHNKPMFTYFLDGSRKTYKVDDMAYANQIYPVIAGQVGVGCCCRENMEMKPLYINGTPMFHRDLLVVLPQKAKSSDWDNDELSFGYIAEKINRMDEIKNKGLKFNKIISYSTSLGEGEKIENKAIAKIQDYMIQKEKDMVEELVRQKMLSQDDYLLKDGSLEYQVHNIKTEKELAIFKNNYQFVVGVSKSFNPAKCFDKNDNNNSNLIAQLPLYSRTPAQMYESERIGNMCFAVWYVRIRDSRYTNNTFDGILKIEKILVNDRQKEYGLKTDEVNMITANIINERNPVCYASDPRWANHLYPVYVTEKYIKSKYLGDSMFLKLF
ncbi:hypothetical protein [uncultured Phascolarctobacterium sp.]|uniref:hypothetical protein n=1 Tax=uncultured Phascolarctobacterium sp. TaxID=512296 RepID=UPI0025DC3241|nr:hypothetical protein [uncultured Phascolarctobacterium sp.]